MNNLFAISFLCIFLLGTADASGSRNMSDRNQTGLENEVDSAFITAVHAAETFDLEKLAEGVNDQYNAGFIMGGSYFPRFDSLINDYRNRSRGVQSQHITFRNKKITVLSDRIALVTASGDSEVSLDSGKSFTIKFFWSFVYEKIDDRWKVIQSHQSNIR